MDARLLLGLVTVLATVARAQPLPPTVDNDDELLQVQIHPLPVGASVWRTPAPHDLRWYIAYDATPLTVDDPDFRIRLVNNGRMVRPVKPRPSYSPQVTVVLTSPDGQSQQLIMDDAHRMLRVHVAGRNKRSIGPGEPLANLDFRLSEYFDKLEPGVHVIRIEIDSGVRLERARDGHVITGGLAVTLPPLRFEVVDRPVPDRSPADEREITIFPETERDQLSGRIRGTLTNPLDVPLTVRAGTGWDPSWSPTNEWPASMYNAIERWTESGWLRDEGVGYCGTGMSDVQIGPGESLPIALFAPHVHDRSPGVYRCVVVVNTPDGEAIEFATPPITVANQH